MPDRVVNSAATHVNAGAAGGSRLAAGGAVVNAIRYLTHKPDRPAVTSRGRGDPAGCLREPGGRGRVQGDRSSGEHLGLVPAIPQKNTGLPVTR